MYSWIHVWLGSISWLCPQWIDLQVQDTVLFHLIYLKKKKQSFVTIFVCWDVLQYIAAATLKIHHIWGFNIDATFFYMYFLMTLSSSVPCCSLRQISCVKVMSKISKKSNGRISIEQIWPCWWISGLLNDWCSLELNFDTSTM